MTSNFYPAWVRFCPFAVLLTRPLADTEKLPVRSHRAAEAPKSPVEDGEAASQEPKKKSGKEKREKKDKDRDRKVRGEYCASLIQRMATRRPVCAECREQPTVMPRGVFTALFFSLSQKSKEEKKKKKKHKHEEKEEDLMGGQADEPAVQSEETNEVAEVAATSTSAEVCVLMCFF